MGKLKRTLQTNAMDAPLLKTFAFILSMLALTSCQPTRPPEAILDLQTPTSPQEKVYDPTSSVPFPEYIAQKYKDQNIEMMVSAFKQEKTLIVYLKHKSDDTFEKFWEHPVLAASGKLGPKRKEGDRQVPEGFYVIDRFNPNSQYHLSLGLDYPNKSDRILGDPEQPGSDIFIHGNAVSIGCLAMGDKQIEQIYYLAELARQKGQKDIPVYIFPFKLNEENLTRFGEEHPDHLPFWKSLQPAFQSLESGTKPEYTIDDKGRYLVR